MTIDERIQQRVEELRGACRTQILSAQELYAEARDEHILALGSRTNEEATDHEISADAYRILAREKEEQEQKNEIAPSVLKLNKEKDLHYTNPDDDLEQTISDYLSNTFGYCHFGFKYVDNGENVRVYDIQWDTTD